MKYEDRLSLLHQVSRMYYEQGKRKNQIAKSLGKSQTHVANLLKEAKRRGVVEIKINLPRLLRLRDQLKQKFVLKDAVVVPFQNECGNLLTDLARAAAEYFDERVQNNQSVALGGGYLMYRMVTLLPDRSRDIQIYPAAIIARGPTTAHIDPLVVVNSLWAKSGQHKEKLHYVTVTPIDNPSTLGEVRKHYRDLLTNQVVKGLFDQMKKTDWVFASIGGLDADESYVRATNYSTRNLLDEIRLDNSTLSADGVIGDIAYSFFDNQGVTKRDWNIVATVGVDHLKRMVKENKHVVVVVGGYKLSALRAVLRGNICNVLITDAQAAESLLNERPPRRVT